MRSRVLVFGIALVAGGATAAVLGGQPAVAAVGLAGLGGVLGLWLAGGPSRWGALRGARWRCGDTPSPRVWGALAQRMEAAAGG